MQAPHHQACHPGGLGLQYRQVADACLVRAAAVVDDQHVAGFGLTECLQEHVHTAVVPRWQDPPSDPLAGHDRPDSRMGGRPLNTTASRSIGHQWRGQIRERPSDSDLPVQYPVPQGCAHAGGLHGRTADRQKPPHAITDDDGMTSYAADDSPSRPPQPGPGSGEDH